MTSLPYLAESGLSTIPRWGWFTCHTSLRLTFNLLAILYYSFSFITSLFHFCITIKCHTKHISWIWDTSANRRLGTNCKCEPCGDTQQRQRGRQKNNQRWRTNTSKQAFLFILTFPAASRRVHFVHQIRGHRFISVWTICWADAKVAGNPILTPQLHPDKSSLSRRGRQYIWYLQRPGPVG